MDAGIDQLSFSVVFASLVRHVSTGNSEPRWISPGFSPLSGNLHDTVTIQMERSHNENEPGLRNLTCTFKSKHDSKYMSLWIQPLPHKTYTYIYYSDPNFQRQIQYKGDPAVVSVEFLILDLTEDKTGTYRFVLDYDNMKRLTRDVRVDLKHTLSHMVSTTPHTVQDTDPNHPKNHIPLICIMTLVGSMEIVLVLVVIVVKHKRRKRKQSQKPEELEEL